MVFYFLPKLHKEGGAGRVFYFLPKLQKEELVGSFTSYLSYRRKSW